MRRVKRSASKPRSLFSLLIVVVALSIGLASLAGVGGGVLYFSMGQRQAPESAPTAGLENHVYAIFSVTMEDALLSQDSMQTLERILDIHERHQVPLDLFFTDETARVLLEQPELLERVKMSPLVSLGYAMRPPRPYALGFDHAGLLQLDEDALHAEVRRYESSRVDATTGMPTLEAGGYAFMKDTLGNVPLVSLLDVRGYEAALSDIFLEQGATIAAAVGFWEYGEKAFGLYARPKDREYRIEELRGQDSAVLVKEIIEGADHEEPFVAVFSVSDYAFYSSAPAWSFVYKANENGAVSPPFDPSSAAGSVTFLPDSVREATWTMYEDLVEAVAVREDFYSLTGKGVTALLEEAS